jgi:tetratricopeptide (TPR) repeat protein
MRAFAAAVLGGIVATAATLGVVALCGRPTAGDVSSDEEAAREFERLRARIDRLERTAAQRSRAGESSVPGHLAAPASASDATGATGAAEPAAARPDATVVWTRGRHDGDVPETNGRGGEGTTSTPVDLSKVPSADLALEADERHARDFDIAGAAKRYRELLARGGTPSERRHWFIRLGDCLVRLQRDDEGAEMYRNCIEASNEDHGERVGCMIALARREQPSNPAEALRWLDRALELETGRGNQTAHELAAQTARVLRDEARETRELQWLVENRGASETWTTRLEELRGQRR